MHGGEVLHFVHHDVSVRLDVVGLLHDSTFAGLWAKEMSSLVQQRDIGIAERRTIERLGTWSVQRLDFCIRENVTTRNLE